MVGLHRIMEEIKMKRDRDEQLFNEVCMPIYKELFKKAEPSVDFDVLIKSGEAKKEGFFDKYYLPNKITNEIIEKHIKASVKKVHLKKYEKNTIRNTILLGCSPTSNKENVK